MKGRSQPGLSMLIWCIWVSDVAGEALSTPEFLRALARPCQQSPGYSQRQAFPFCANLGQLWISLWVSNRNKRRFSRYFLYGKNAAVAFVIWKHKCLQKSFMGMWVQSPPPHAFGIVAKEYGGKKCSIWEVLCEFSTEATECPVISSSQHCTLCFFYSWPSHCLTLVCIAV